jgi:hypothetical protein
MVFYSGQVDLISIDFSQRLPFHTKSALVKAAVEVCPIISYLFLVRYETNVFKLWCCELFDMKVLYAYC